MSASVIGEVLLFLPKVALGTVAGVTRGVGGTTAAAAGTGVYSTVASFVGNNVGAGVSELSASGISKSFVGVGAKEGFQRLLGSLASMGPKGLLVLGGVGILATAGVTLGLGLYRHSSTVLGDISRGHGMDLVNNEGFHIARLLSAGGMIGGGIMTLIPGMATLGIPLLLGSMGTSGALAVGRQVVGGVHMGNYAEMAPWPFNLITRQFHERPM